MLIEGSDSEVWWAADFETTSLKNLEKDGCVRVWLWSLVGVTTNIKYHGIDIQSFLKQVKKLKCKRVFFHNLKFDGKFIVDYFARNNFEYGKNYEVIIDGLGSWYEIKWHTDKNHTTKFWDSLKKFPGTSVKQLGKLVGLPKLDAPHFDKYYPDPYYPTKTEVEYCIRDSEVIARALEKNLEQGFTSITMATDCFKWGKERCLGGRFYRDVFPLLSKEADTFIRNSYHGGITYLKPEYEDIEVHGIKVFDFNSLYPSVMHDLPLPYGQGIEVEEPDEGELYFVNFNCEFVAKINKFPFLQIKNTPRYRENQFVLYSDGVENLTMTCVDYLMFKKNYKVIGECDHKFIQYKSAEGIMAEHVDYWMEKKVQYQKQGLDFMKYIAKTMMNGFYGKTALRTTRQNVVPVMDMTKNQISYGNKITSEVEPVYIPYGSFVTSWARHKLIDSALKVWDDFVYCDTDSIHCFERKSYPFETDPYKLGVLKDETPDGAYEYARYIKQKTYCHARPGFDKLGNPIKEVVEIKAAGLNTESRQGIPIDSFKYGLKIEGANLKMKVVPGGAVLYRTDWELVDLGQDAIEEYFANIGDSSNETKDFDNGDWKIN